MECPICYDTFNNEIYMCLAGHSVCSDCCKSIFCCPICRKPMSSRRNIAMEEIIAEMQAVKENDCPICAIPAPKIKTKQFAAHLDNHQNKFLTCTKSFEYRHRFQKKAKGTERDLLIVNCDNKLFKFCVEVKQQSEKVSFTLHSFNKGGSEDYSFELKNTSSSKGQSTKIASSPSMEGCGSSFASIAKREFMQDATHLFVSVHCFIGEPEKINKNNNVTISYNPTTNSFISSKTKKT